MLFIVSAAQALAFVLTLQQVPHAVADMLVAISGSHGTWLFLLLSIAILIVMGSVLEGAAALIIFGPLLMPVAIQLGIDPLHFGVVLVFGMGIGLFAPPLGLGLYGACLIGKVPIEETVKPILGYLGLLFLCLLVIAFVPSISTCCRMPWDTENETAADPCAAGARPILRRPGAGPPAGSWSSSSCMKAMRRSIRRA